MSGHRQLPAMCRAGTGEAVAEPHDAADVDADRAGERRRCDAIAPAAAQRRVHVRRRSR